MAAHTYEPDIQGTEAGGPMKVPGQPGDIVKPCLKKTNNRDYKGLLQGLLPDWPLPGVAPTSVSCSLLCRFDQRPSSLHYFSLAFVSADPPS